MKHKTLEELEYKQVKMEDYSQEEDNGTIGEKDGHRIAFEPCKEIHSYYLTCCREDRSNLLCESHPLEVEHIFAIQLKMKEKGGM